MITHKLSTGYEWYIWSVLFSITNVKLLWIDAVTLQPTEEKHAEEKRLRDGSRQFLCVVFFILKRQVKVFEVFVFPLL